MRQLRLFLPAESGLLRLSKHWYLTRDWDPMALELYQKHYTYPPRRRQGGFVGPGEKIVLLTAQGDALFVWRRERYRKDGIQGVNCSIFRNESAVRSSLLIEEACEIAWRRWPQMLLFTFVNPTRIRSTNPGCCFRKAGFVLSAVTQANRLLRLERAYSAGSL